ncbi:hypothetical protein BJD55_gp144 [Gordonia phage Yvonnetastic]|uniref:Uncharacterized protein n=1 Tax=Gordonia phage Yvonnetastic TaxID=1821566 RepID=A0A142K939_9CAUD|nr:hypothetical protein BJD55_gp144 [Gordonia phage Yvonnetastic]AMS02622.1 hypothetical protein SEA_YVONNETASTIC_78 [Gordonia phage Yvonnetastic]WKW86054.1 hypothetical protein SEA_JONJAMES_80 [Gordonia Phage JonJames]
MKSAERSVNEALVGIRSHHTHIICQLCTGPYWSAPVGDRTRLIDELTEHLCTVHGDEFEEES